MVNLITQHIATWTGAEIPKANGGRGRGRSSNGHSPHGIKKLRELILELAVRGKLVPQDPSDEPASVLLEKIAKGKARLIKEGKIKTQKPLPKIGKDEWPFELPQGWEWVQIGRISVIERGGSPRPIKSFLTDDPAGLNWIKISDTEIGGKYISSTSEKIRIEGLSKTRMVYPGDFLLTNSMSFGRPYITKIKGCIHDGWLRISPPENLDKDYLYFLLSSPYVRALFRAAAAGAVVLNLNADKVRELPIPIPPVSEQNKIAAKVDELMALCDKLEQQQTDSNDTHQTLVEALLATLTTIIDQAEFALSWQRIVGHFDTLFTTEESIDQLKQTILQLAVMGKLVSQDPNDEPASTLLEKIAKEKAKLIKEGKIKKQKPLPKISEDEKLFDLPEGWVWTRLGNLSANVHYGYTASAIHGDSGIRLLRITDIQNNSVDWGTVPGCEIDEKKANDYLLENDDVLIARTGGTIGKSYLVENIDVKAVFASYLIRVQRIKTMYSPFIKTFLGSQIYWQQLYENSMGTGQPNVNATALKGLLFPLPPLPAQHRIVAKVDELMALCDTLKERLHNAQITQVQLADAIVEQAVA